MMKYLNVVLVAALLLQTVALPCAAQETIILKGNEISESRLEAGMYVEVTYTFRGRQAKAKGYIQSVRQNMFTVLDGSLKTIKYADVITFQIKPIKRHDYTLGSRMVDRGQFLAINYLDKGERMKTKGWVKSMGNDTIMVRSLNKKVTYIHYQDVISWQREKLPGKIVGEFLLGGILGFGSAILVGSATHNQNDRWSGLTLAILAYVLGSSGGVYLIGSRGGETGSFTKTMVGGMAGFFTGVIAGKIGGASTGVPVAMVGTPLGAVIGFNTSSSYKPVTLNTRAQLHVNLLRMEF